MPQAIDEVPFPHVCIEHFIPTHLYESLAESWDALPFVSMPSTGRDIFNRYFERGVFEFTDESISATPRLAPLLKALRDCLIDKELYRPWIQLMAEATERIADFEQSFVDVVAVQDSPGYSLSPHTDSPSKSATFVIYLPDPDSDAASGTVLLKPKSGPIVGAREFHHPWEAFEFAKQIPYLPNLAFGFIRTDHSFHAVRPVLFGRRRVVIVTFYTLSIPAHFVSKTAIESYNRIK